MKALRNRRRAVWLFVVHLVAMLLCLAWLAASPRADAPEELNVAADTIPAPGAPWIGVGGCAAAACHGGEIDKPRGEYTTWITRDPHSQAFSVLFGEPAVQMAKRLAGGDATKFAAPHEDRQCLECHAPTGPLTERTPQLVGDGVGCEACHGGAEKWSTEHATIRWQSLSPADQSAKRRELGMTDMHDVLTRAQQCTPCHVGDDKADVDHDLIAAGHPRMSLELGAFHDALPKHWPHEAERRRDPAFEAKLWAVGQATSAAANFDLVAARAERGNTVEFSNFDCYACHHELRSPSWRQADQVRRSGLGQLQPLQWYDPRDLFDSVHGMAVSFPRLKESPPFARDGELVRESERAASGLRSHATKLRELAAKLNAFEDWNLATIEELQAGIAANPPADLIWDRTVQWYLALVALERARLDHRGNERPSTYDEHVQSGLQSLKALLDFPMTAAGTQFTSPRYFDPDAFRTAAERLKSIIAARGQPASGGGAP